MPFEVKGGQGSFHVKRHISGGVQIRCPGEFSASPKTAMDIVMAVVKQLPPQVAVQIVTDVLKHLGIETVVARPGQTVIRPPTVTKI